MSNNNQDIGALLAEVNAELIFQKNDHDDYELNFESDDNNNDYDNDNDNDDNTDQNYIKLNSGNQKIIDTSKILKDAAQVVQKEEKVLLDEAITNVSNEIKIPHPPPLSSKQINNNNDALNILIEACHDIDQSIKSKIDKDQLNIKMIDDDNDKMMNITNDDSNKENNSDDDDDDGDDDDDQEEDNNGTSNDASLNQTLLFACYNDKIENVKLLLNKNINYFIRDRHGWTPLHWACSKGYEDIVNTLISHVIKLKRNLKVYINAQDKITGWTALHVSKYCNTTHIIINSLCLFHREWHCETISYSYEYCCYHIHIDIDGYMYVFVYAFIFMCSMI